MPNAATAPDAAINPEAATPAQLVQALMERGHTQPAIAVAVKTSQPTISRIYTGGIIDPKSKVVDRLRALVANPNSFIQAGVS